MSYKRGLPVNKRRESFHPLLRAILTSRPIRNWSFRSIGRKKWDKENRERACGFFSPQLPTRRMRDQRVLLYNCSGAPDTRICSVMTTGVPRRKSEINGTDNRPLTPTEQLFADNKRSRGGTSWHSGEACSQFHRISYVTSNYRFFCTFPNLRIRNESMVYIIL